MYKKQILLRNTLNIGYFIIFVLVAVIYGTFFVKKIHACTCACHQWSNCNEGPSGCYPDRIDDDTCSGVDTTCAGGETGCDANGNRCREVDFQCNSGRCGSSVSVDQDCHVCGCSGGGPPGGCFVKETKIKMADGTEKNIEEVKTGDLIQTMKEDGSTIIDEVLEPTKIERQGYYILNFEDDTLLNVTENHPLWSKIGDFEGWASLDPLMTLIADGKKVERLKIGDSVFKENRTWVKLVSKQYNPNYLSVYNLKLAGNEHSYFANGVYVHNKGCEGPPGVPTQTAPANGAAYNDNNNVNFTWTAGNWPSGCSGERFQVQAFYNAGMTTLAADSGNLPKNQLSWNTSVICDGASRTFWWRVIQTNEDGSANSVSRTFTSFCYPPTGSIEFPKVNGTFLSTQNLLTGLRHWGVASARDQSASNSGRALDRIKLYFRKDANRDGTYEGPWVEMDTSNIALCNDQNTCNIDQTALGYTPNKNITFPSCQGYEGLYQIVLNVFSTDNNGTSRGVCTGNPDIVFPNVGWSDCGAGDTKEIRVIDPPTATLSVVPNVAPSYELVQGTTYTFTDTATDCGNNLNTTVMYRRKSLGGGVWGPPIQMNSAVFTERNSYALAGTWNPASNEVGTWRVFSNNASDLEAFGDKCTSDPVNNPLPAGWQYCGANAWHDFTIKNNPSVISTIYGTDKVRHYDDGFATSDTIGLFNLDGRDPDGNSVGYLYSSVNPCTLKQPQIQRIEVMARGSNYLGWPIMRVMVGDIATGTRSSACADITVNTAAYPALPYSCVLTPARGASSIDVVFTNDANGGAGLDRNLYVDWVRIVYTDGSTTLVQSNDINATGTYVIYDTGDLPDGPFDGLSVIPGQEAMGWTGSLRIPVPVGFTSLNTAPTTCTLTVTATDGLVGGTSGPVSKTINLCGSRPTKATNVSPTNGQQDVALNASITWTAPNAWGDKCSVGANTYNVWGAARASGSCPATTGCPGAGCAYTKVCSNVAVGNETCNNAFFHVRDGEFCWFVESTNSEYSSLSDVWWFENIDPLLFQNWITALGGGIFGGLGFTMSMPSLADSQVPWTPPETVYNDASFSRQPQAKSLVQVNTTISLTSDLTPHPQSESNVWGQGFAFDPAVLWPLSDTYQGNPPANANVVNITTNSDCDNLFEGSPPQLDPDKTTVVDVACAQRGINGLSAGGRFKTKGGGPDTMVSVVYITGTGTLTINKPLNPQNDKRRIMLITGPNVNVVIAQALATTDPAGVKTAINPTIMAPMMIIGNITYEGNAGVNAETSPDSLIGVEGPVIVNGEFHFRRNRGMQNFKPSGVFRYNPDYLYTLTDAERSGSVNNYTGLFVVDVDYIDEN